ncbi:MAG: NADPH-dependent glutamate synthase [Deltaproteobacteria bacterium]
MPNLSPNKVYMPVQEPSERKNNFKEVAIGYTYEQAREEAERCLHCSNSPCVQGCPVNVQIPEFINLIKENKIDEAYSKILETNSLPAVCGRVCPQENQCEKFCVRGKKGEPVAVGRLERFAADNGKQCKMESVKCKVNNSEIQTQNLEKQINYQPSEAKVAIIGSGPAGLTCAGDLVKMGYKVTIFEAFHVPGGVMVYGIPEFRLPKKIVQKEIDNLKSLGVEIKTNMVIGRILNIDDLFEMGFSAVFIGSGAGLPMFMKIPGENLNGVMSANEFLTRVNLMKAYMFPEADSPVKVGKKVAVVGGGNVAMDAARCALRLGAEKVYIIYRRSDKEMPARHEEVEHAQEEGIEFRFLTNPVKIIGNQDGWAAGIECVEMELGEPDLTGRRKPIEKADSNFVIDADTIIMAIGTTPNPIISDTAKNIKKTPKGGIFAEEETGKTSREGVYAGGDIVTGAATVILAMGAGKKAAKAIDEYIKKK